MWYKSGRAHQALGTTPAIPEGVGDRQWHTAEGGQFATTPDLGFNKEFQECVTL